MKTTINLNTVLFKVKQWYLMLHPGDYIMAGKNRDREAYARVSDMVNDIHSPILHFDTTLVGTSASQTVLQSMMLNKEDKISLCSSDKACSNPFRFGK